MASERVSKEWEPCGAGLSDGTVLVLVGKDSLGVAAKPGPHLAELSWDKLRPLFQSAGLHIVTEAERKVLDACAAAEITTCTKILKGRSELAIVKAELTRRGGAK